MSPEATKPKVRAGLRLWLARAFAVLLALVGFAVLLPDIPPRGGWPRDPRLRAAAHGQHDPVHVALWLAAVVGILTCIFVGQRRSRALEVTGWALLLTFLLLELRLV